jgi:hypothetical protein
MDEKIKLRTENGQLIEVVVLNKRADLIEVVIGEGVHNVRCTLTPTRNGLAYVGSVMGREVIYERSRARSRRTSIASIPTCASPEGADAAPGRRPRASPPGPAPARRAPRLDSLSVQVLSGKASDVVISVSIERPSRPRPHLQRHHRHRRRRPDLHRLEPRRQPHQDRALRIQAPRDSTG